MLSSKRNPFPSVVFVLGAPGAGKATQSQNIASTFGLTCISTGALLRAERDAGQPHSDLLASLIRNGEFVPKELVVALLQQQIEDDPNKRGFIINGFPRALDQATFFEEQVAQCKFILYIDCPETVSEKRLLARGKLSGRVDDNLETIKKRIRKFKEETLPVINYYRELGKVHTVSGSGSVEEVFAEIRPLFETVPPDVVDISKMQSILDMNPIYTAEQIVIPPELPDILREWSKQVIRTQPDDLLAFSADYFQALADQSPLTLTIEQLVDLHRTMSTSLEDVVSRTDLKRACDDVGIQNSVVDHVLRIEALGGNAQVDWPAFVVFAITLIAEDLAHSIRMLFAVFGHEHTNDAVDADIVLHLLQFLARVDPTLEEAFPEISARVLQLARDADADTTAPVLITFQDYLSCTEGILP